MKVFGIVGLLVLAACSGASPDDTFRTATSAGGGEAGSGGGAGGDASSSSGGYAPSTSSGSTVTGSTSSGTCQSSITCASVGAECGTILDDGCGNQIDCPNNCTGFLTCGGGGDQFKCGCTPKTESDFPNGCEIVDDGCGGTLDLGSCGNDPYYTCGGDAPPDDEGNPGSAGVANICNGGCTRNEDPDWQFWCEHRDQPYYSWKCSVNVDVAPFDSCEQQLSPDEPEGYWCCPNAE